MTGDKNKFISLETKSVSVTFGDINKGKVIDISKISKGKSSSIETYTINPRSKI
jgi:hypothetical protein